MGRGKGVEIRGDTIRLSFYLDGKRKRPMLKIGDEPLRPNKANLAHAANLAEEIRRKIKAGEFVMAEYFPEDGEAGPTTVSKQLDTWLAAQRVEKSTKAGYEAAANFWKHAPYTESNLSAKLGDVPIRALKPSQVSTALAMRPELSGKTINNYTSALRRALKLAKADKLITELATAEVPSAKWQKEPPDPFTPEERDKIIAQAHAKLPAQVANLIQFWMWTGLRTGELIGLRWANVDLASGTVLIKEARVRKEVKSVKTKIVRTVRLNSHALDALTAQKAHTFIKGVEVFQDPRSTPPAHWDTEASFRKVYWTRLLKTLGIRYRRPYQCRHTYATEMLHKHLNPAFAAKQLGHDVKVFLGIYSKWIEGDADDAEMAKLEDSPKQTKGVASE